MDEHERLAILAAVFACSPDDAVRLHAICDDTSYAHRETVALQGDACAHVWVVLDGSAHAMLLGAEGQWTQLTTFEPGELFGTYPAAAEHRAEIVAQNGLVAVRCGCGDLDALAGSRNAIARGLSVLFARQLDLLFDRMAARATLTATGRVHAELLRLADEEGHIAPPPVIAALAASVQTTRETASRAINALERRGIIARDGAVLDILAPRMLADMVV